MKNDTAHLMREIGVDVRSLGTPPPGLDDADDWAEIASGPIRWACDNGVTLYVPDHRISERGAHIAIEKRSGTSQWEERFKEEDGMYDVEFEDDVPVNTGLSKLLAKTLSGDLSIQQLFVNKATLIENHLPAECWIIRTDQRLN